jgi:hypothetical protein
MQLIMHKALRRAIDDLYALSQLADREDAEHIRDIIERPQALDEQGGGSPTFPGGSGAIRSH